MSRSPESKQVAAAERRPYEDSWEAIYNLVDEGAAWSGNERNCCFLNTRTPAFANVSAATGLDYADDGRAVALTDWDLDGRLDIWVTNRTAPRVRFLRNSAPGTSHFVLFKLRGSHGNRDAVGARLELRLGDGSRQIRTARAGDGYLAQSSKWLHFGLGEVSEIVEAVVRWPGGEVETFRSLSADARWVIIEGSGLATKWAPPRPPLRLEKSPIDLPDLPDSTRTWIAGRVPFPALSYEDWDGSGKALADHGGRPLLVNLWSSRCGPCVAELAEWKERDAAIREAGLDILPLCVDDSDQRAAARRIADALPFPSGIATPEIINAFETTSRAFLESRAPLPVPCSILLDARGLVAAIYQGTVPMDQLLEDIALLDASAERQRAASLPFAGRWMSPPLTANPRQIIGTLMKAGQTDAAGAYTERCLRPDSPLSLSPATRASLTLFLGDLDLDAGRLDKAVAVYDKLFALGGSDAGVHREVGIRLVTKQRVSDAIPHLEKSVALDPGQADARLNLASLLLRSGLAERATAHFRELVRQLPDSAPVHFYLANALQEQGLAGEAIAHYRSAHRLQPGSPATNNLAWILATHEDPAVRNGAEAVTLAEQACQASGSKDPALLNTLAAAYAETGAFDKAISTGEVALKLARAVGNAELTALLSENMESFRAGTPLR